MRFISGMCHKGDRCHRQHITIGGAECREFKIGECKRGRACPPLACTSPGGLPKVPARDL